MKTLLIVDDDRSLVESLCAVFDGLYTIRTAFSAEEAALAVREHPVDVVLLDVVLPGADGVDFLKALRMDCPRLPVVMLSGAPSIRPVMQAMELGAIDYIRKPFDIAELRLVVARALQIGRLHDRIDQLERELADRPAANPGEKPLKQAIEELECELIKKALEQSGGIQTRAAEVLGTTRRVLRYRIEKLGIRSPDL
jgi:DNA-binding NtrC family response regulator